MAKLSDFFGDTTPAESGVSSTPKLDSYFSTEDQGTPKLDSFFTLRPTILAGPVQSLGPFDKPTSSPIVTPTEPSVTPDDGGSFRQSVTPFSFKLPQRPDDVFPEVEIPSTKKVEFSLEPVTNFLANGMDLWADASRVIVENWKNTMKGFELHDLRGNLAAGMKAIERGNAGNFPGLDAQMEETGLRITVLMEELNSSKKKIEEFTPDDMNVLEEGLWAGVVSFGSTAPAIVAAAVTRKPELALAPMYYFAKGQSLAEASLEDLSVGEASLKSLIDSTSEVLTEAAPMMILSKILSPKYMKTGQNLGHEVVKLILTEGVGEQVQTAVETLNNLAFEMDHELQNAETTEEKLAIQGRRQAVTAIATMVGVAAHGGIAKAGQAITQRMTEKEAETDTGPELVGPVISKERAAARKAASESVREFEKTIEETLARPDLKPKIASVIGQEDAGPDSIFDAGRGAQVGRTVQDTVDETMFGRLVYNIKQPDGEYRWTKVEDIKDLSSLAGTTLAHYNKNLDRMEDNLTDNIKRIKRTRDHQLGYFKSLQGQGKIEESLLVANEILESDKSLATARLDFRNFKRSAQEYTNFIADARNLVQEWQNDFLPNIIMSVGDLSIHFENSAPQGDLRGEAAVSTGMATVGVNPLSFMKKDGSFDSDGAYTTLAHEFGHVLFQNEFFKLGPKARAAIHKEYLEFLETAAGQKTLAEAAKIRSAGGNKEITGLDEFVGPPIKEMMTAYQRATGENSAFGFMQYFFSFNEYSAQQMAKYQTFDAGARRVAEPFFKKVVSKLGRFFKKNNDSFAPGLTYTAWLKSRAANLQLVTVESKFFEVEHITPETFRPRNMEALQAQQILFDISKYESVHGEKQVPLRELLKQAEIPLDGTTMDDLSGKRDNFSRFKSVVLTLLQIGKKNPHIPGLATPTQFGEKSYIQLMRNMATSRLASEKKNEKVLHDWRKLGANQAEKVGELLMEADRISFLEKRLISPEELREMAKKLGMNEDAIQQYGEIRRYFASLLERMENSMADRISRTVDDTLRQEALLNDLREDMNTLRNRNFFPSGRFGKHVVVVRAKEAGEFEGRKFTKGETLLREHYETKADATSRAEALQKTNMGKKHTVFQDKITEEKSVSFRDLPPSVLEAMKELLPEEDHAALNDALIRTAPGQGFSKHLLKKRGIAGASRDYMKSFLSYAHSFERHMERIELSDQMDKAIGAVNRSIKDIQDTGGDATKRRMIKEWMQEHKQYVFNPGQEFDEWSALAFNWYLAGVPKQAVLNILQVPTIIAPQLHARYGIKAEVELVKAIKTVFDKKFNPTKLDKRLQEAYMEAELEGFLDQSFAHEAAGLRQGMVLKRLMPGNLMGSHKVARANAEVSALAAYMFHKSEIFTRRIAFTAAWNLEMQESGDVLKAFQSGREAVQNGAFEYAQYNRPKLMRGKTKPIFIFQTHMQHYLEFVMGNNPGKWYALAILIALAGMEGLPFARDLLDVADWAMRKYNKLTGNFAHASARVAIRQGVHDMVSHVNEDSASFVTDVMLHGAGRYGFGLPWLGEKAGVPIPNFDLTGSISLGNVLPGTTALNSRSFTEGLGRVAEEVAGPGLGIPITILSALADESGDPLKRAIKLAPKALSNPLKAYEYATRGATNRLGIPIVEFDEENPLHQAEIISQALGMPVTRVNVERSKRWMQRQTLNYYQVQRGLLSQAFTVAIKADNAQEAKKDVLDAIREFNSTVPHPSLRLSSERLRQSVVSRLTAAKFTEKGVERSRLNQPTSQAIGNLFPDSDETLEIEPKTR